MKTDAEIIAIYETTGHLRRPFDEPQQVPPIGDPDYPTRLDDPLVRVGTESYQDFFAYIVEPDIARTYPERGRAAIKIDGKVGPVMQNLFDMPRCACPDYVANGTVAAATGSGNWKSCHNVGNFHSMSVTWDLANRPGFLVPLWDELLNRVREAYAEVGLLLHFDGRAPSQIRSKFTPRSDGWIGLASVLLRQGCNAGQGFADYLATYTGGSTTEQILTQWTTLLKHEYFHNCGGQHGRSGVTAPVLQNNQPTSWRTDPSWSILAGWFGGERVPIPGDPGPGPGPAPPTPRTLEERVSSLEILQGVHFAATNVRLERVEGRVTVLENRP